MSGSDVAISGADGAFTGYLATPASGSGPGIIVVQEVFGVNQVMRDVCDGLAAQGYLALCPDLFWRQEPGIQITDQTEAEWKRAFELYQGFDVDSGVDDLAAAIATLRTTTRCSGGVGGVGYCLGGLLAYLMATRTTVDGAASYYGVGIEKRLAEASKISTPLLMHVASEDQFVPKEAQAQIRAGLEDNALVTIHVYEGQDHAFARPGGEHYDKAAADLANQRTLDLFQTALS